MEIERYSRQLLVIGLDLQQKLKELSVAIIGCGALGTAIAEILARMGIGKIRVVDADIVEISNIHRTHLFDEGDLGKPKVIACGEKLRKINSNTVIEEVIDIIDENNVEEIVKDSDIIFDALDNLYYKLLINDIAVKKKIPLIHGGISGEFGSVKLIVPYSTSCLSCFIDYDSADNRNSCDIIGTLPTIVNITASLQVQLMLNYLRGEIDGSYYYIDARELKIEKIKIEKNARCKTCSLKQFPYLSGKVIRDRCGLERINYSNQIAPLFQNSYVKVYKDLNGIIICYKDGKCFLKRNA